MLQLVWMFSLVLPTDLQEKNIFCTDKAAVVQNRSISGMISSTKA